MTHDQRRARTAALWVGVIVPLAILALAAVVVLVWLPEVPNPSAIHWGTDGADGFGSPWMNLGPLLIGAALVISFAVMGRFAGRLPQHQEGPATLLPRSQDPSFTARFLAATSLGLASMMGLLTLVIVGSQRGLEDAQDAPDIGVAVLIAFAVLVGVTALGWFLQPASPKPQPRSGPSAAPLPLADGASAAWFGSATLSRSGIITLGVLLFITLALGVGLVAVDAVAGWILVATAVVLILLMLATSVFHVRADSAGLHVRGALGWPRYEIPAAEIASVRAVAVNPFGEFGGWGIRWGVDGRFGVVLRTGEGIEVTRKNGKIMVVTVDDATTCAAVLSTAASARKDDA